MTSPIDDQERRPPAGAVLLAAGRGSRLATLTRHTHKSLLPVAGSPALQRTIDALVQRGVDDIVVVTGDKRGSIEGFVRGRYGDRITLCHNEDYATDTNILSTELGVGALHDPAAGYLIVETDLVLAPDGWDQVLTLDPARHSFWVTKDTYHAGLTGGALRQDAEGRVAALVYAPIFTPSYVGWPKLLGLLYVGPAQVAADRELRQRAIGQTTAQYYMMPWVEHLDRLPCRALDVGSIFAASFNDLTGYQAIAHDFAQQVSTESER